MIVVVVRTVFFDVWDVGGWLAIVVRHPTGVFYEHQYGGTACLRGSVEGSMVPVHAPGVLDSLRQLFEVEHQGTGVSWGSRASERQAEAVGVLRPIVEQIIYWASGDGMGERLALDEQRVGEVDEAWVPVLTSDGPGVLVWNNSD